LIGVALGGVTFYVVRIVKHINTPVPVDVPVGLDEEVKKSTATYWFGKDKE
jgi:N-glycosylase/DNA lyase